VHHKSARTIISVYEEKKENQLLTPVSFWWAQTTVHIIANGKCHGCACQATQAMSMTDIRLVLKCGCLRTMGLTGMIVISVP
jgi:hypothetical protein